jgi:plastocyanin
MGNTNRGVLAAVLAAGLVFAGVSSAVPVQAQTAGCQFVLGFATMRSLIGAQTVGQCLEDQRFAPNGDAQQQTSGGLLVWRKVDNWTAFTDGAQTWLNGPQGLQRRPNETRFVWEGDAIGMQGNAFQRADVTVPAGTTLWWVNADREDHDVIARDLSFESPVIGPGASWSHTFDTPGTFAYVCDLHANMEGTVTVTS